MVLSSTPACSILKRKFPLGHLEGIKTMAPRDFQYGGFLKCGYGYPQIIHLKRIFMDFPL
jgi:hypothetical protein